MAISWLVPVLLVSLATPKLARQSWLDKMVAFHKKNFLEDFANLPPMTVTIKKAPAGFVDSPKWDKEAVLRLFMLVEVLDARAAKQTLRLALAPSRRVYLPPGKNTFELFPSLGRDHPNNFEYDDMVHYDEQITNAPQDDVVTDDTVVYISNPVEAHLPSSMVTVRLLREIMEHRAAGLRIMPSTTRAPYSWKTKTSSRSELTSVTTATASAADGPTGESDPPPSNGSDSGGADANATSEAPKA